MYLYTVFNSLLMNTDYFYDESDKLMFPAKPKVSGKPRGMMTISLNFVFYLLIYFFVFNGDLKFLAALLMVMFIHEFGHFVMMKRYGYSDKSLFFIPFMNLFFSENDENQITLKQKLFIIFLGPVPGIVMGLIALYFGERQRNEQMELLAWIFLIWNLINLFPIDSLDGGRVSENLFHRHNFIIQSIASIFVSLVIVFFVLASHQFILLVMPVFLGFRLHSMLKMKTLRKKLEEKGIDCALNYDELNNKQYWLLRKELLLITSKSGFNEATDEFVESVYEGLIMKNIKSVLLDCPYDDLGVKGKLIFSIVWAMLFFVPVLILITSKSFINI